MVNKLYSLKQTSLFFFVSYISILIFSFFLYTSNFTQVLSYEIILKSLISSVILWYILYFASYSRVFYYFVIFLLTLITTIKIYYTFILGVHIEPSIFEGMFDTNLDEAKRLGSSKPIFIFLAVLSFFIIVIEFNWFKSFAFKKRVKIHIIKVLIVLVLLVGYGVYKHDLRFKSLVEFIKQTYPVSFVNNFYKAVSSRYSLYKMNRDKIDIVKKYKFTRDKTNNTTVVFVRAEALRARSFPIVDKKIPLEYRIDDINNIVYYKSVFSYANYTQAAVPWIITRSVDDKLKNEKSLISVVRSVGFDTTWLGCDHSNLANFATPIVNYSLEANRSLFLGKLNDWIRDNHNNEILKNIYNVTDKKQFAYTINSIKNSKDKDSFFWVELNGSHVPWSGEPNEHFRYFLPVCTKSLDEIKECSQKEAENSYKTTIIYTQYLLRKLILSLKDKNAIVFFVSDHGESTGESGFYGHGFMLPEDKRKIRDQINPAFMVWMSDKFKIKHKKEFKALKNNSTKYMKHDIVFHSVLDILGIKSSIIEKSKSIFSNEFAGVKKQFITIKNKKNIVVEPIRGNKVVVYLNEKNPIAGYKGFIEFNVNKDIKELKVSLGDLYKDKSFPNRIKYRLIYNNRVILEKDLADDNIEFANIDLKESNHNIRVEIEAFKGIEKDWAWGSAAKVEVNFIKGTDK